MPKEEKGTYRSLAKQWAVSYIGETYHELKLPKTNIIFIFSYILFYILCVCVHSVV